MAATDLRRTRDELVAELDELRGEPRGGAVGDEDVFAALDAVPSMIVCVGPDERYRFNNRAHAEWFGVPRERLAGLKVSDVLGPETYQQRLVFIQQARAGEPSSFVGTLIRGDGAVRTVQTNFVPHIANGCPNGYFVVIVDVTEREKLEEARAQALHNLTLASRAKSEFLANMSHELRTPLNAVIGFSEVIENELYGAHTSPLYKEYAADIRMSGIHLLGLINDILDLSKIEAGKLELREEPVDIKRVVEASLRLIGSRTENGGVDIRVDLADGLPMIRADERKLRQILLNLLSNAVKFTPAGGSVCLTAEVDRVAGVAITVADTGIGIAEADIATALAPFGQVDGALNRKFQGTGLGLPLTKSLVEKHGGKLELYSEVGVGTTVIVRFPTSRVLEHHRE